MANKPPFILFKVTAKGNPSNVLDCIDNIDHFISDKYSYKILICLNYDDKQLACRDFADKIQQKAKQGIKVVSICGDSANVVQDYNRDCNVFDVWKILVCLNDNMRFTSHGFDDLMRAYFFNYYPDYDASLRFIHNYSANTMPLLVVGRRYFTRIGYLYHNTYHNHYFDKEHLEVAGKTKKLMLSKYKIHSLINKAILVEANKRFIQTDRRNFINRKKNNYYLKQNIVIID